MRRFVNKSAVTPQSPLPSDPGTQQDAATGVSSLDIENLLDKCAVVLQREISNLMMESSGKKLGPASARDLVAYIKLLSELKANMKAELASLNDEALRKLAQPNPQS